MRPDAVHDQRKQQKNQAPMKIAELSGFCHLGCASCHGCPLSESGYRATSGLNGSLGTCSCSHAGKLDRTGEFTALDHFYHLGHGRYETCLLESCHIDFRQTQLLQSAQSDFVVVFQRLGLETA